MSLETGFASYDVHGTARTITAPDLVVTQLQTDARGRTIEREVQAVAGDPDPASYRTQYHHDSRDRLDLVTLPNGNKTAHVYEDGTNRLRETIRVDSDGLQRERLLYTLNDMGGKVQEEVQVCDTPAPACAVWTTRRSETFTYDAKNRLQRVVHPVPLPAGSTFIQYAYDENGQLESVQDERHTAPNTIYTYDELHRLTRVTRKQALLGGPDVVTEYAYDVRDNLTSVTDPNGNTTTYLYDDFGRLARQTSPVSGVTAYSYDQAGNLVSSTDANLATTARTHDAAGRITQAESTRAGYPAETVTWTYDATAGRYGKGRLATVTAPSSTSAYTYERRGLPRTEERTIQGDTYSLGYTYDGNGNRTAITYPSGRVVRFTFDFADRPMTACSGGAGPACTGGTAYVSSATYLPFGPESSLTYGNGTTRTMTYDTRYRPGENKLVKDTDPANPLAHYNYGVDSTGNITLLEDAMDGTRDRTLGYDDLNRLTTANSGASLWGTGSYAYDAMGNMTSAVLGSSTRSFFYAGTTPKLASVTENGVVRPVTYDDAGNESTVGGAASAYSTRNLLVSAGGFTYTY